MAVGDADLIGKVRSSAGRAWYSSFALWMALLTSDRAEDSSEYSWLISDAILASHSGLGSA